MAVFVVIAKDAPDQLNQRLALRPQHVARLQVLQEQGQLLMAGPMPVNPLQLTDGVYGSMLVVEFDEIQQVHTWLQDDPFVQAGVYASVEVYPYIIALQR